MSFIHAILCLAVFLLPQQEQSQHRKSPVFKSYSLPGFLPLLEQSDATYQMWEGFRVQQKANSGDVVSQFELSIRYLTGRGFRADTAKAVYWTTRAAEQNHLLARYNLGIFYFQGWGVEWNPFESYRNFLSAADGGIVEAQYALSQFLTENLVVPREMSEAYRWTKRAADSGFAPAGESLREFERRGYGEAAPLPDQTKNASPPGAIQLMFLSFSDDTAKSTADSILVDDLIKAAGLSRSERLQTAATAVGVKNGKLLLDSVASTELTGAAEAGSPEALTLLGRCHETGLYFPKDLIVAAMYYISAIRLDSPRASRLLYSMMQQREFFPRLKAQVGGGNPDAEYVWPCLIALGFDRQLTDAQARQMLERAVAQKHPRAMVELGLCHYSGRWVKQNDAAAERLWREATSEGSNEGRIRLAISKVRGRQHDYAFAIPVLQKAAGGGSILAEYALGYCYETGSGIPKDRAEAARRYRSSSQRGSQDAFRSLIRMHDALRPKEKQFQIPG